MKTQRSPKEAGSALVELLLLAVAMLVPLSLGIVSIFTVQAASYAAEGAVREAARVFVTASDETSGRKRSERVIRAVFSSTQNPMDQDIMRSLVIRCANTPCLTPGSHVDFALNFQISLPLGSWKIRATHQAIVDPWVSAR
jgi:hypothetical protein